MLLAHIECYTVLYFTVLALFVPQIGSDLSGAAFLNGWLNVPNLRVFSQTSG